MTAETVEAVADTLPPVRPATGRRLLALAGAGVLLALLLYYPVGDWRAHKIDDDVSFHPDGYQPNQSMAVAVAAALLHREIDVHGWTANKPFFMPAAILDDMPAYQKGITAALGRFAIEMDEAVGRDPAAPEGDADLARAAGLLQYPPNIWMIDPAVPWATTLSTDKQYRNAARALEAYNLRLAAGTAAFSRQAETLRGVTERFAKALGDTAAGLDPETAVKTDQPWRSDRAFYDAKGRAYASFMVLRGLGGDFAELLAERGLGDRWQAMLTSLRHAAEPRPLVVLDGAADSLVVPNHLANQGFQLLRARDQLAQLAEALR
jgi:hypothetical protein